MANFSAQAINELDQLEAMSTQDALKNFCKDWPTKWRPSAVTAQSFLNAFFPMIGKILGLLIALADTCCPALPNAPKS